MNESGDYSLWFVLLSVASLLLTLPVYLRIKNIGALLLPWFFLAWLGAELAWFHILWESIAVVALLVTSPLAHAADQFALALMLACIAAQLHMHIEGARSGAIYRSLLQDAGIDSFNPNGRAVKLLDGARSFAWLRPFHMRRAGVERLRNIAYDGHERNRLDIYRPRESITTALPVLLQVHGGAWVIGEKEQQGLPLMYGLAENGWLCVAINYRLGPHNRMPAHIEDVKKALLWIRQNIADYGGDPGFVAVTGGSAGGQLSSLAALTAQNALWQPGFEQEDLSVQACVPFYGAYDFCDRNKDRGNMSQQGFLEKFVMPSGKQQHPVLWEQLSPISHVGSHAPPMMVIHGSHDSLIFVEEARSFVRELRAATHSTTHSTRRAPLVYAELPRAQHAFDVFHSPRTEQTVAAVQRFLEHCYASHLSARPPNTRSAS